MKENIDVLAAYLGVKVDTLEEISYNSFKDEEEQKYYVIPSTYVWPFIVDNVVDTEANLAEEELGRVSRNCLYRECFKVDDDAVYDFCLTNLEDILDTEPREEFVLDEVNYIILKVNG